MVQTVDNVTCAACGCVCEGITVRIDDGQIVEAQGACRSCQERLIGCTADQGEVADCKSAVREAVEIMAASRAPLIYGLANSTVETQRAAVALADSLGATIDLAMPPFHRDSIVAMQNVGISTCTLGEVYQRADIVVFWGAVLDMSHPSLMERFIEPSGKFVVQGRHIVAVGEKPLQARHDELINIDTRGTLTALTILRALVSGTNVDVHLPYFNQLKTLADRLANASYSAFFFGPEVVGLAEMESLFLLVRQLNQRSRSVALGLGGTMCENVLAWQTGFPFAVNFARGYPRFDPHIYSANEMLEGGVVDSVVLVGSKGVELLSPAAQDTLMNLPAVSLVEAGTLSPVVPTALRIASAIPGVHCGGMVFRMDGVPLPLRPIFHSSLPTSAEILTAIQHGVSTQCV